MVIVRDAVRVIVSVPDCPAADHCTVHVVVADTVYGFPFGDGIEYVYEHGLFALFPFIHTG